MIATDGKDFLKRLLRKLGWELHRTRNSSSPECVLKQLLATLRPSAVVDVGANIGQYAMLAREVGYEGLIVSFEAQSAVQARLLERARHDPRWIVAPPVALGSENGTIEINVSANSVSSSVLPMRDIHRETAPDSAYVGKETVKLQRLDDLLPSLLSLSGDVFLKIDTQGYEREVLKGASGILGRISAVQLELSLVPLYDEAPTLTDMLEFMQDLGYELFNVAHGFKDVRTGRLLQMDGFFVRAEPHGSKSHPDAL